MNSQHASHLHCSSEDGSVIRSELHEGRLSAQNSIAVDELVHEIRQPLSVIESLAYYLELTSADEMVRGHVKRIQAMVLEANQILERTYTLQTARALATSPL